MGMSFAEEEKTDGHRPLSEFLINGQLGAKVSLLSTMHPWGGKESISTLWSESINDWFSSITLGLSSDPLAFWEAGTNFTVLNPQMNGAYSHGPK